MMQPRATFLSKANLLKGFLIVCYSVFLVALYQLVVIPLALDFSYWGLAIAAVAGVIGYFAVPNPWRRFFVILTLLVLLISYGVNNTYSDSVWWRIIDFILLFLVLGWLARLFGKIRFRQTLLILVTLTVLQGLIPLDSMPFYSHFTVVHKSEGLDPVPLFPLYPIVEKQTKLYTLGDPKKTEIDKSQAASGGLGSLLKPTKKDPWQVAATLKKQLENNAVLRFSPASQYRRQGVTQTEMASLPFTSFGLVGFPYYTSSWSIEIGNVHQHFQPVDAPVNVLRSFLDPLSLTTSIQNLAAQSVAVSRQNWTNSFGNQPNQTVAQGTLIGKGKFLPGPGTQLLIEGTNELRIVDANSPNGPALATFKGTWEQPLSHDILIADIDGQGQDEILLNTSPARILKLRADRSWETLWQSAKDSFRFEMVLPNQVNSKPLIVANDPSFVRDQPARYLTGYTWNQGALTREWRVFKENLILPFVQSDGTWVVQVYNQHQFFVLKPSALPITAILEVIYVLLILIGIGVQVGRGGRRHA